MPAVNVIVKAFNNGKEEGIRETRLKVLDFLEKKYMNPEVVRKTPLADGILEMASELAELLK